MKKLYFLLLFVVLVVSNNYVLSQAPTPLYAGERYSTNLRTIDTTTWSVVSTVSLTSDFGYVSGTYGLSLDPVSDEMYILYQSSAGSENRRLGTLNPMTGSISDIGDAGNMTDIAFGNDGTLYGTGGNWSGYEIYEINPVTGTSSVVYDPPSASWGTGITYNPFSDELLRADYNDFSKINPGGFIETPIGSTQTETQAMVVINPTTAMFVHYGTRYSYNLTTGARTIVGGMGFTCHALGFGQVPCEEIDITVSTTELCEGEDVTLTAVSATGGSLTWDGGVIDGVPFAPGPPGTYTYTVTSDSEDDCEADPVVINVIGLPTVIAGAGDLIFCEDESITLSAGGDADLYIWEDGDPLDLTPGIGTYTFNLTGYYTEGGCLGENTDEVTVEVVALPTITATASDSPICFNNEVTFTAGGGVEYEWDNGVVDGEPYTPAALGVTTYTVYGTDANGCSNMASVDVEVVEPVSLTGVVTEEIAGDDGAIDITISGGAPAYTFDWDNDGTGDFDDTEDLSGLAPGFYTVVVQSDAGCGTSYTFEVGSQVSVDEFGNALINVYPNPTQDNVNIELAGAFNFEIVCINGEVILSGTANDKKVVSMKEFADGVYFINVKSDTTSTTVKVVKK